MSDTGFPWARYSQAIADFSAKALGSRAARKSYGGPYRALFFTYDFDRRIFERDILRHLQRRGRAFRTAVFVDASALDAALRRATPQRIAPWGSYEVHPVRTEGAFHPKLCLLIAGRRCLAGLGSSNLTSGGLGGNLELFSFAETDLGTPLTRGLLNFVRAATNGLPMSERARRVLRTFAPGTDARPLSNVLHSMDGPLLPQVMGRLHGHDVSEIHVVSPLYARVGVDDSTAEMSGLSHATLQALGSHWPRARLSAYTQFEEASPLAAADETYDFVQQAQRAPQGEGDEAESALAHASHPSTLHAKLYLFVDKLDRGYLLTGSANLTAPALLRGPARGGNVELLIEHKLASGACRNLRSALQKRLFRRVVSGRVQRPPEPPPRTRPRGHILEGWQRGCRLVLTLASPFRGRLRLGRDPRRVTSSVQVRSGREVDLPPAVVGRLGVEVPLPGPTVLWEFHAGGTSPFLVNPTLVAPVESAEGPLDELRAVIDELDGRPPAGASSPPPAGEPNDDELDIEDDSDPLAELTSTEFHGDLDRLALLAVLLRRRLASSRQVASDSPLKALRRLWPRSVQKRGWYPLLSRLIAEQQ